MTIPVRLVLELWFLEYLLPPPTGLGVQIPCQENSALVFLLYGTWISDTMTEHSSSMYGVRWQR